MLKKSKKAQIIQLAKKPGKLAENPQKRPATKLIRKQPRWEISYQINDIKVGVTSAHDPIAPDRQRLLRIYQYIKRDGHLSSQVKTAKIKVASEPWLLYQNGTEDLKHSELFNQTWMNAVIEYIVESEFFGYSPIELDGYDPANAKVASVVLIDREYISIDLQSILLDGSVYGTQIPYANMADDIGLLMFGKTDDLGSYLECSYNVIWKYYSRSDWSRGSEKFGMPVLSITADTTDDTELDELETRAANFGTDGYMIGQKGDEIKIIERNGQRMHDVWLDNIKLSNEEISKIINGNTATSDTKSFTGSAEVQERTMDDFTLARLQNICNQVNDILFPFLTLQGFPVEGYRFDYPRLKREREKRIKGIQTATDPKTTEQTTPKPEAE